MKKKQKTITSCLLLSLKLLWEIGNGETWVDHYLPSQLLKRFNLQHVIVNLLYIYPKVITSVASILDLDSLTHNSLIYIPSSFKLFLYFYLVLSHMHTRLIWPLIVWLWTYLNRVQYTVEKYRRKKFFFAPYKHVPNSFLYCFWILPQQF